ncbi:MAG: hypothetical protein SFV22_10630 [Saprospiraceae bacterium]|nr:hypothetical protein [Saprospiraceae bacterium]
MQPHYSLLDEPLEPATEKTLELTEDVATHWVSTAGWAYFFALLLFVGGGLTLFLGVFWLIAEPMAGILMMGSTIVQCLLGGYLWRFQSKMKKALYDESDVLLEDSFRALRNVYIIAGVICISFTLVVFATVTHLVVDALLTPAAISPETID